MKSRSSVHYFLMLISNYNKEKKKKKPLSKATNITLRVLLNAPQV